MSKYHLYRHYHGKIETIQKYTNTFMIFNDLSWPGLMTSLTFYGEVNEIGGNKILLEDKDTKSLSRFWKGL